MKAHTRAVIAVAAGLAAALALAWGLALLLIPRGGPPGHPAAPAPRPVSQPSGTPAARAGLPASTLLATTHGAIAKFAFPGGPRTGQVPGSWHDAPSVLPVIARQPGWLKVRLAQRPNESTAWVMSRDVTLSTSPYAIVLDLAHTHLSLYRGGRKTFTAPIGIGTARYPTPAGTYFLAFLAGPPIPAYGAFVMVTSAHSNVISDWKQSGDGMVAIHGPLHSDAQIGTTGARISHGCIRMHEHDLLHLRDVPVGSPVIIKTA